MSKYRTFKINNNSNTLDRNLDDLEALRQTIECILKTIRFEEPIYSDQYGIELDRLIGQDRIIVKSIAPEIITSALMTDERITGVEDFKFEQSNDEMTITFTVKTIYGEIEEDLVI